jgi:hypothetical protein
MAAQRYKDILFSYMTLISGDEQINFITEYFASSKLNYALAEHAEIMDLTKYTVRRNPRKIKELMKINKETPFVFVTCMN